MTHNRRETIIILVAAALVAAIWWGEAAISRPEFNHLGAMSDAVSLRVWFQKIDNPQSLPHGLP